MPGLVDGSRLHQIGRSLQLTERALELLDGWSDRPNPFGPPVVVHCYTCRLPLAGCTCWDHLLGAGP